MMSPDERLELAVAMIELDQNNACSLSDFGLTEVKVCPVIDVLRNEQQLGQMLMKGSSKEYRNLQLGWTTQFIVLVRQSAAHLEGLGGYKGTWNQWNHMELFGWPKWLADLLWTVRMLRKRLS